MTHDLRFVIVSDEDATLNVLPPRMAEYGVEEPFATGSPLRYPDFDLYYLGVIAEDGQKKWRFRLDHREGAVRSSFIPVVFWRVPTRLSATAGIPSHLLVGLG